MACTICTPTPCTLPWYELASLALYPWIQLAMVYGNYTLEYNFHNTMTVVFLVCTTGGAFDLLVQNVIHIHSIFTTFIYRLW